MATYIAIVVRNAMEDFHCKHIPDEHMRELNPIIRNAICTALHAMDEAKISPAAEAFVGTNLASIPQYWEPPELLAGFVEMETRLDEL